MNVDEDTAENIRRALGSDHADPPDEQANTNIPRWQFQIPGATNRQPFHPPPQPPPRRPRRKEEEEVEEAEVEVEAEEAAEEDYPHQQDQACSLHTDELLTQSF
jgi:hypothetical protein